MLTTDAVGQIKAAQGIYRASDVARAYEVHRSTVKRIWDGAVHKQVSPATDFPDIAARPNRQDLADDLRIYMERGMKLDEAAQALNISRATAYQLKGIFV